MTAVIEIDHLSRRFGAVRALEEVTLSVPSGSVFGLVGQNGAGKTTLLKHLLGLFRPQQGQVRVFGQAPDRDPVQVLSRIGYLSEDRVLPEWMTVAEIIRYTAAFYPDWDDQYVRELLGAFELSSKQRIGKLSRGQRARVGLLLALAYRPPLLLLDEPSSGLDPLVRRDILGAIIRAVAEEGRTIVFSSHLLDEVQRVADHFAMLHQGRVAITGSLDELLSSHHRLTIRLGCRQAKPPQLAGALLVTGDGLEWTAICNGQQDSLQRQVRDLGGEIVERARPTLEEVFLARSQTQERAEP